MNNKATKNILTVFLAVSSSLFSVFAISATIGDMAPLLNSQLKEMMVICGSFGYIAGFGLAISAIVGLKKYTDGTMEVEPKTERKKSLDAEVLNKVYCNFMKLGISNTMKLNKKELSNTAESSNVQEAPQLSPIIVKAFLAGIFLTFPTVMSGVVNLGVVTGDKVWDNANVVANTSIDVVKKESDVVSTSSVVKLPVEVGSAINSYPNEFNGMQKGALNYINKNTNLLISKQSDSIVINIKGGSVLVESESSTKK